MACERNIRHLHHIATLLTTCPALPASKAQPRAICSANCIPNSPRYTGITFSPSPPSTFSHFTCYTSSTQSAGARPPKTKSASLHAHAHAHRHHQASTRGLLNTRVSLCFGSAMLSSRSMQALRSRRSSVQPCHHTFTVVMPPSESADPCFMAAGSTQNVYTRVTRPLSLEDETMLQALHDKWGRTSNSKFIQIYRAHSSVGFPTNFLAVLNRFRCKVYALCKGARGYRRSTRVQLHGPHKTLVAVPASGDIVFCNSNDDSTIRVVTAELPCLVTCSQCSRLHTTHRRFPCLICHWQRRS